MNGSGVTIGKSQITFHHVQCRMSQHPLQSKNISPIPEPLDGECMPESVGVYVLHVCSLAQAAKKMVGGIPIHALVTHCEEKGVIREPPAVSSVQPYCLTRNTAHVHDTSPRFVARMERANNYFAGVQLHVTNVQPT